MATCPNCGSMVMEGDPYCSHCGAHFKWVHVDDDSDKGFSSDSAYGEPVSFEARTTKACYVNPEPFLDYGEISKTYRDADEDTLECIACGVCATSSQKLQLKSILRQYQKARDFTGFHIQKDYEFEVYYFHFIQENQYVKTTHVMTYINDPDYYRPYRAFHEEYSRHGHDGLYANPHFKRLVESVGLELDGCGGGYETHLEESGVDVELTGEIRITVRFKVCEKIRVYELDLDEMKLSKDYYEYFKE